MKIRMRQLHAELEDLDRWSSRCMHDNPVPARTKV